MRDLSRSWLGVVIWQVTKHFPALYSRYLAVFGSIHRPQKDCIFLLALAHLAGDYRLAASQIVWCCDWWFLVTHNFELGSHITIFISLTNALMAEPLFEELGQRNRRILVTGKALTVLLREAMVM